jgi:tetratricopeptide (TPR) repeat protein
MTAAILLVFAVHPVHSESVAWISGSPDPLLACFFLGSLLSLLAARQRPHWAKTALAWFLAALAMLTKEVGIVLPLAAFVLIYLTEEGANRSHRQRVRSAFRPALPLMVLAVAYFLIRLRVIGRLTRETPWESTWLTPILSAPSVIMFYLRQGLAPFNLGPSYPLRPVASMDFTHFFLPAMIVAVTALLAWRCLREGLSARMGLALFLLLLLPAFNVGDLMPEQIVHDRYLYLPLLGLFMLLVPGLLAVLRGLYKGKEARARRACYKVIAVYSVVLAVLTIAYNRVWTSELQLWDRAVQSDPGSSFNWGQYAIYLEKAGRLEEAGAALDKSMKISPVVAAIVTRADLAIKQGRFAEAESDLLLALEANPTNVAAYERLTLVYQQTDRVAEAIELLQQARIVVPYRRCAFTSNLAVLHYLQGDRERARVELETILPLVDDETNTPCRVGLFHLGTLYTELGLHEEARTVLARFLALTANVQDAKTRTFRERARATLDRLAGR